MTRKTLNRTLRRVYVLLGLILAVSLFAKFAEHSGLPLGKFAAQFLKDIYEFLRDMALLIATGGVAYITNVFQKRSGFIESLREEWRDIIQAKSALFAYTHLENPTHKQWVSAFSALSETIDNMRIVYRNVGETDQDIGLYPFAPLHDMRRALQTLDPRKRSPADYAERKLVRDSILRSFYALREMFLEELDLEEPDNGVLATAAHRLKRPGYSKRARGLLDMQHRLLAADPAYKDEIDSFLKELQIKDNEREAQEPPSGNGQALVR